MQNAAAMRFAFQSPIQGRSRRLRETEQAIAAIEMAIMLK
jgi:hypothetical protein